MFPEKHVRPEKLKRKTIRDIHQRDKPQSTGYVYYPAHASMLSLCPVDIAPIYTGAECPLCGLHIAPIYIVLTSIIYRAHTFFF